MLFEICVDSVAGVRAAKAAGAHRVELCAGLFEGGITPSRGMMKQAREASGLGLHVIIRPRGGDFVFDADEVAVMLSDIATARDAGADGVVIGALTPDGRVEAEQTARLVEAAGPMAVTFHRAFDMTVDPFASLETLVSFGIARVLTSGQEATVLEGAPLIRDLMRHAGDRIVVMPGGGITARNAARIAAELQPREMHFAALVEEDGPMRARRGHVFMGGELRAPEYSRLRTSQDLVATIMREADSGGA